MSKVIPVVTVKAANYKEVQVPDTDDDDKPKQDSEGKPLTRPATSKDLMEAAVSQLSNYRAWPSLEAIRKKDDVVFAPKVLYRCAIADGNIVLHDKVYDWLHDALKREVPCTEKEAQEMGVTKDQANEHKPSFAVKLWGNNAAVFANYLKPIDDQKNVFEDEEV